MGNKPIFGYEKTVPDYLDGIWPFPDSETLYNGHSDELATDYPSPGDFDVNWPSRCSPFVDGVAVADKYLSIMDGVMLIEGANMEGEVLYRVGGPYYLIW